MLKLSENILNNFLVRKTKKQKNDFINLMKENYDIT